MAMTKGKTAVKELRRRVAMLLGQQRGGGARRAEPAPFFADFVAGHAQLQRALHIHIPKCGGTSIRRSLVRDHHCIPVPARLAGTLDEPSDARQASRFMLQALARGAAPAASPAAAAADTLAQQYARALADFQRRYAPARVFLLGHRRADELLPYYRPERDFLFAAVRAPIDILRSNLAYRVAHVLEDPQRPDSVAVLRTLKLDGESFEQMVRSEPRRLADRILQRDGAPLAQYLSCDGATGVDAIWAGIVRNRIYLCELDEQAAMMAQLMGEEHPAQRENSAGRRSGLAAEYAATVPEEWLQPHVDDDSSALYRRIHESGVSGFWRNGGTPGEYDKMLHGD